MYRTKKDVDKHVSDILNKLKNENERNNRGFVFAQMYVLVRDYESAKRFLAGYLSIKERDAAAHYLMGKIHEQTLNLEKALQSYKRSLELEENQKEVILKICELYCQIPVDPERARYWADRAETLFPNHEIVFKLRECIVTADGDQNSQELEDLIAAELAKRPRDARLRIKLIKLYLDTERVDEAYEHAILVESKRPYSESLDWYYCLTDTLEVYFEENGQKVTSEFYFHALNAHERLVHLCLDERGKRNKLTSLLNQVSSVADCAVALHSFDQILYKACQLSESRDGWWGAFLTHMYGQLYFHLGTFILKRAKKDYGHANAKEATRISAALFLAAYTFKLFDLHSVWFVQASEAKKKEYMLTYKEACYRLSQSGHVIISLCKEERSKWLQKIRQHVCTPQGREKIFQRFCNSREIGARTSSLMADLTLLEFTPEFPDIRTLQEYDDSAHLLYPDSLHHTVWLAIQYYTIKQKIQPDYRFKMFDGLQLSINNLNTANPESLCQLDIDAFLHATVQTTVLALEERNAAVYGSLDFPNCLPASISIQLCSDQQANWWSAAYQLFNNLAKENLADMRRILQHGIEVIRLLGVHGIDASLAVHLAETFAARATELKEQNNNDTWRQLESRAAYYWRAAIDMLEKLSKNQLCRMPKERLFNNTICDLSTEEIKKLLEEGNFYLACQAMNCNKNEEALEMFDLLKTPYSSYYQALIYKKLASEDLNQPRELITSEMRSKHIILLTKARDAFYVTLDRIQGNKKHPLNQSLSYEIEEIETKLARIDPDTAQRHAFDGLSDECVSSQDSDDQESESPRPLTGIPSRKSQTLHSTPHISVRHDSPDQVLQTRHREEHTRPSPERLDAQVRYLTYSQESMFKQMFGEQSKLFGEQTKMFTEMSGKIVEELKEIKIHLEEIGKQIAATNRLRSAVGEARRGERVKQPKEMEASENEEYDYDNYYYDEDETDECAAPYDYHYNAAYKYSDPVQSEYPYGHVTGLHGTSTVTYAPPQAGGRGLQPRSSYPNYYPNGPPPQPMHPGGTPAHVLPPGHLPYFGAGGISTGLPFSEGQKLPEFNFNPALTRVQTTAIPVTSPENLAKQSVLNRLGPLSHGDTATNFTFTPASVDTTAPQTTPAAGFQFQLPIKLPSNQGDTSASGFTTAITTTQTVTSITTTVSKPTPTAPHAFQITMPPNTPNEASATFKSIISSPSVMTEFDNEQSSPDGRNRTASGDEEQIEESTGGDFQPVIPLPDEVEVRTGEEEENVLFESRAKLFRFVNKEWKERGIGVLKILFNDKTGRSRILMRRDQVWKICANHFILSDMKLASMKDNETSWLWAANDFADETMVMERFCVKFKTAEIAQNFKKEFEKAQEKQKHISTVVTEVKPFEGFGDKFKPKAGTWSCEACLLLNKENAKACVACSTPKSGLQPEPEPPTTDKTTIPPPKPAFVWPTASTTTKPAGNVETTSPEVSGFKLSAPATTPITWTFGFNQETMSTPVKTSGFVFGGDKSSDVSGGGFVFGASAVQKTDEPIQYGGFTFKSSPTIKSIEEKTDETKTVTVKPTTPKGKENETQIKANKSPKCGVFAQFSFSPLGAKEEIVFSKPSTLVIKTETKEAAANISGIMNKAETGMSFSSLATVKPDGTGFKKDPNFKGFEGSGKSVFQLGDKSSDDVEAEADVQFEPVVPLPDLIEVKTGEEDDDKLFGERARLYRYDSATAQWKERGIGEMKILKNRLTGAFRILMRREQVHKVCANHRIEAFMELTKLQTSERAMTWVAKDFSEEVESDDTFAARFKTQELAEKFTRVFQDCIDQLKSSKLNKKEVKKEVEKSNIAPLSELFKPKENSWECSGCLIRNDGKDTKCAACSTNRTSIDAGKVSETASLSELFKPKENTWECPTCFVRNESTGEKCVACSTNRIGAVDSKKPSQVSLNELFKPVENSWECMTCLIRNTEKDDKCVACNTNRLSAGADVIVVETQKFQFGDKSDASGFKFGMTTPIKSDPVFKFGSATTEQEKVEFKFGTPQNFTFSFSGVRPKSPLKTPKTPKTPEAESSGEADDSVGGDDEGDHIFFSPVIPLPDKVDVKTGEEDEDVLYCQRAKLFRMVGKEWKERGIGDFKILKHKETGKVRFLMRREQVHKVCLNHYFSSDLNFVIKDEKSWLWCATDFADNEAVKEVFTLRFKTPELSKAFMDAVENAKTLLTTPGSNKTGIKTDSPTTSPSSEFSFKMSPSSVFSFGSKFGVSTVPSASIFGGSSEVTPIKFDKVDEKGEDENVNEKQDGGEDDLLVLYVKEPTSEQKNMAAKLMLPPNFYLYEHEPPCPGCRGCNDEDWSFESEEITVETGVEFEIVKETKAEPHQVKQALDLNLPPNFYLYENKDPCPGCRGCDGGETNVVASTDQNESKDEVTSTTESKPKTPEKPSSLILSDRTGLDFATLAQNAGPQFKSPSLASFTFGGNIKVFETPKNEDDDGETEETTSPHQPDIHFEPIVPLPELVEVKTGEEDEDIIYNQRAKLYRFDVDKKEWKERGVGEAKILKHKKTNRYRMILRREQVYKIACNHYITADMNFEPLATSETAFRWTAMDFADEKPRLEQFAIKFKNVDLANQFAKVFKECQEDLNTSNQQISESFCDTSNCDTSRSSMSDTESSRNDGRSQTEKPQDDTIIVKHDDDNEGDGEEEEEDDDDDCDSVMFEKRVNLASVNGRRGQFEQVGMGNLRVLYDDDFYGARIQITTDNGDLVCNHLISVQNSLTVDAKVCTWGAEDYSRDEGVYRQFQASFSSIDAAKEFQRTFLEGKDYAKHSDIWERPYNPAGGDSVGDNGTATTGSNDEIKACSPELVAALAEIIRGSH